MGDRASLRKAPGYRAVADVQRRHGAIHRADEYLAGSDDRLDLDLDALAEAAP
jgi:hypothetical protein